MNKLFIAFVAFIATFFVHGFQFFKKQTPLVNTLVVGLVVYFVAGFLGFKEGLCSWGDDACKECGGTCDISGYCSNCTQNTFFNTSRKVWQSCNTGYNDGVCGAN